MVAHTFLVLMHSSENAFTYIHFSAILMLRLIIMSNSTSQITSIVMVFWERSLGRCLPMQRYVLALFCCSVGL